MADCKFCGKPAGLFHHEHKDCKSEFESGLNSIRAAISAALSSGTTPPSLPTTVDAIATKAYISAADKRDLIIHQWGAGVDSFLSDGTLDEEREDNLIQFLKTFSISKEDANKERAFDKLVKAATLRDVMEGKIPARCSVAGLSINFLKT